MDAPAAEVPSGARLARALSHPVRRRLFFEFHRDETSPSRAARRLGEPLNVVSYHTHVLLGQGCIALVRSRRRRGAVEHFYRTTVEPIIDDAEWAALPGRLRRTMTLDTLVMLDSEARRAAVNGGFDAACTHLSRTPLDLDERGRAQLNELLRGLIDDALRMQAESLARHPGSTSPVELVMLHFGRASTP